MRKMEGGDAMQLSFTTTEQWVVVLEASKLWKDGFPRSNEEESERLWKQGTGKVRRQR